MKTQNNNDTQLRQWAMLRLVPQHPRQMSARELTEKLRSEGFDVSKRTVERDLVSSSTVFPLVSNERSKPYGWSWSKDAEAFALPTMSPLQALTLELAHDHLATLLPASLLDTLIPYFKCAEGVLSSSSVKKLANWRKKVAVVPATQPLMPPNYSEEVIETVHAALLSEQRLEITYDSREHGKTKTYELSPLGIVQRGPVTYLVGTIYNYTDIRLLALHRIKKAHLLDQSVSTPENFDLETYIKHGSLGFDNKGNIKLIVRLTESAAVHLWETPLAADQKIEPDQPGYVKMQATVPDTAQLRWWLLGFSDQLEVLEPAFLREEFAKTTESMCRIYHP